MGGRLRVVLVAEEWADSALRTIRELGGSEAAEVVAVLTDTVAGAGGALWSRRPRRGSRAPRVGGRSSCCESSFARELCNLGCRLARQRPFAAADRASDVLEAPRIGSFNLHPGPLPEYAGLNAPSWAIYHGEQEHRVTLHWLDAGIDTGPIAYGAERFLRRRLGDGSLAQREVPTGGCASDRPLAGRCSAWRGRRRDSAARAGRGARRQLFGRGGAGQEAGSTGASPPPRSFGSCVRRTSHHFPRRGAIRRPSSSIATSVSRRPR